MKEKSMHVTGVSDGLIVRSPDEKETSEVYENDDKAEENTSMWRKSLDGVCSM